MCRSHIAQDARIAITQEQLNRMRWALIPQKQLKELLVDAGSAWISDRRSKLRAIDFDNCYSDTDYMVLTGLTKSHFDDLLERLDLRDKTWSRRNSLAVYLVRLRTGENVVDSDAG